MEQNKIWDYFQNQAERDEFSMSQPRYLFLAKKINVGSSVLNIGVGRGGFESVLVSRKINVSSLDPSDTSIASLKERLNLGDNARVGVCQKIPFKDDSFDFVVMSEVLEHLNDEIFKATMLEVGRVLKSGGRFIGTVPANEDLKQLEVICPKCGEVFHKWGHVQSFSIDSLRSHFVSSGFSNISIEYRVFPNWGRPGLIGNLKSIARYILGRLGVTIALPSLFFDCMNKK